MTTLAITTIEHETDIGTRAEQLAMTTVFIGAADAAASAAAAQVAAAAITTLFNRIYLGAF